MKKRSDAIPEGGRDRLVRRNLLVEGAANVLVLLAKVAAGLATGSLAILGDALHSLTDVGNNVVALFVTRLATKPPDRDHPYGHRKYETLAVFGLAGLLTATALQIIFRALPPTERTIATGPWSLATMIGVLAVNAVVAWWQSRWAARLDSDLLRADARHTLGDVLTTVVVIAGWQFAAAGPVWLDSVFAVGVALIVLYLAYGLFKRSIPVLVDGTALDPDALSRAAQSVPGVERVTRVRSRRVGRTSAVDLVVTVAPELDTIEAHDITNGVERALCEGFGIEDVTVHVEPGEGSVGRRPR